jgi:hypothetical protein
MMSDLPSRMETHVNELRAIRATLDDLMKRFELELLESIEIRRELNRDYVRRDQIVTYLREPDIIGIPHT